MRAFTRTRTSRSWKSPISSNFRRTSSTQWSSSSRHSSLSRTNVNFITRASRVRSATERRKLALAEWKAILNIIIIRTWSRHRVVTLVAVLWATSVAHPNWSAKSTPPSKWKHQTRHVDLLTCNSTTAVSSIQHRNSNISLIPSNLFCFHLPWITKQLAEKHRKIGSQVKLWMFLAGERQAQIRITNNSADSTIRHRRATQWHRRRGRAYQVLVIKWQIMVRLLEILHHFPVQHRNNRITPQTSKTHRSMKVVSTWAPKFYQMSWKARFVRMSLEIAGTRLIEVEIIWVGHILVVPLTLYWMDAKQRACQRIYRKKQPRWMVWVAHLR